ncbi:trypsin alpha-like [Anopheles bellator]|uniref:trypsin alpha-like n=1 Tax=Anopheles bellator TaxID=139047 RepID=UPI00264A21B9|nr:trypsin alpha-like [Anopheles bellator]
MRISLVSLLGLALLLAVVQLSVASDFLLDTKKKRQDGRIVGGAAVTIDKYPYVVSLRRNLDHVCAGSVISPYYAVTCAHCTYSMSSLSGVTIYAGSTSRTTGGKVFTVTAIIRHSEYNPDTFDVDVSVVRVSTSFTATTGVGIVQLADLEWNYPAGMTATVLGWGRTTTGGSLSASLRAVSIPIISNSECAAAWKNISITNTMMCAGAKGRDACTGDSGGPLVVSPNNNNSVLAGMVSWGSATCGSDYPGVYTRVTAAKIRNFLVPYV